AAQLAGESRDRSQLRIVFERIGRVVAQDAHTRLLIREDGRGYRSGWPEIGCGNGHARPSETPNLAQSCVIRKANSPTTVFTRNLFARLGALANTLARKDRSCAQHLDSTSASARKRR